MMPKQLRVPVIKGEQRKAKLEKMAKLAEKTYKPTSKKILKANKLEVHIQNRQPAEYVPIYFQAELNKTKEDMGFWK